MSIRCPFFTSRLTITVLAAALALFVYSPGGRADAAVSASLRGAVQPDVQVLLVPGPDGQYLVDLTYKGLISGMQAQRDVTDIDSAAGLAPGKIDISNEALPLAGVKPIPMTSVTFSTNGALHDGATTLRLEPWIVGLKNYRNLAVTYLMPPQFAFDGLRKFENDNVRIALDQRGSTYTYHVRVLNPNFTSLDLPLMQPDQAQLDYASAEHRRSALRVGGLILLSALAAGMGYGVYVLLSRVS